MKNVKPILLALAAAANREYNDDHLTSAERTELLNRVKTEMPEYYKGLPVESDPYAALMSDWG